MDQPEILGAAAAAAFTILAGVIGYAFREYRNRAKPFMAITQVEGDLRMGSARVDVTEPIVKSLRDNPYITVLDPRDTLDEVWKTWQECRELSDAAPELLEMIDRFLESAESGERSSSQASLYKILGHSTYTNWFNVLLGSDRITVPTVDENLAAVVPISESTEFGGCLWVGIPGLPFPLGRNLDSFTFLKPKCLALASLIERMDLPGLTRVFREFATEVRGLNDIARDIEPLVNDLLDSNSTWSVQVYIANLGRTPFLIERDGMIHVEDETGAKYDEPCKLLILSEDEDGDLVRRAAETPLVLGAEADATFAVVTSAVQSEMKRGDAFREAFSSGSALCWVELGVQKVGLRRHSTLRTPKAPFAEA